MASKSIGTLSLDLIVQTGGFEAGMDKAERIADAKTRAIERRSRETAKSIESAFTGIAKSIAGPLAAAFSVNMFAGMIKGAADAQDHLNDLTKSTSLSVSTLAGLGSAARKSGGDLDSIAASVNKLAVNMGKDPLKFAAIGITAKEPLEALKQLSDVFVAIKDPQERAAFAAAALGKSWEGTAPLLAEGGAAISEMVEKGSRLSKVTAESAQAADVLNDQLEDLKTTSDGLKTSFANMLIPSLAGTAAAMEELVVKGNPALALLRGFAGLGKLPFDLAFGSVDTSITGQLKDLEDQLSNLQQMREAYNPFVPWGDSLNEIDHQITVTKNQLEALKKYGDVFTKKPVDTPSAAPDVRGFLDDKAKAPALTVQISEGQRLIDQLKDRLLGTQELTEVEKLQAQFANERYSKATAGERGIALGIAAQIDARKNLMTELDAELVMAKQLTAEYDRQDARLKSLVGGTDIGKNTQNMLDEAMAESALRSGKIDTSTYDQIIEKMRELKDEGKDTFKELQDAIDGWGKQSAGAIADFCTTGKLSFGDMSKSIINDLIKMAIQQSITGPLFKAIGGWAGGLFNSPASGTGAGSALPGSLFGSANGNVFSGSSSLHQYANTVQTSPKTFSFDTLHGFAKGGVFAEAGPEAVMPLHRSSDGKLGVKSSGGSGDVQVNITINDNGTAKQNSTGDTSGAWTEFAARMKAMILQQMMEEKRPGGLLYN